MFTQTLSDLTLEWSKVRSDKVLCVNTALDYPDPDLDSIIDERILHHCKIRPNMTPKYDTTSNVGYDEKMRCDVTGASYSWRARVCHPVVVADG